MSRRILDLTGQRIGRLVALSIAGRRQRCITWLCQCDCGAECVVVSSYLVRGLTKSCGCLRRETYVANMTRARAGAVATQGRHTREDAIADTFRDPLRLLDKWREKIKTVQVD